VLESVTSPTNDNKSSPSSNDSRRKLLRSGLPADPNKDKR
jgi:hypothetical protein